MIDYQRKILADVLRNDAFYKALKSVIVPGKSTVIDLGSGTGFLAFVARTLGAKHCTLVEQSLDLLNLSKKLARENGISGCTFIHANSGDIDVQKPVDIVVSETLSNLAMEEHIIETMADARRMLKPGGVQIPQKIEEFVAPVVSPRLWQEVTSWRSIGYDLSFAAAQTFSLQNSYVRQVQPSDLPEATDACHLWDAVDLCTKSSSIRRRSSEWKIVKEMTLYGFCQWWKCTLVPGIEISTSPFEEATHWEQIFLPCLEPLSLIHGDTLVCTQTVDSRREVGLGLTWSICHRRSGKVITKQDLDIQSGFISR